MGNKQALRSRSDNRDEMYNDYNVEEEVNNLNDNFISVEIIPTPSSTKFTSVTIRNVFSGYLGECDKSKEQKEEILKQQYKSFILYMQAPQFKIIENLNIKVKDICCFNRGIIILDIFGSVYYLSTPNYLNIPKLNNDEQFYKLNLIENNENAFVEMIFGGIGSEFTLFTKNRIVYHFCDNRIIKMSLKTKRKIIDMSFFNCRTLFLTNNQELYEVTTDNDDDDYTEIITKHNISNIPSKIKRIYVCHSNMYALTENGNLFTQGEKTMSGRYYPNEIYDNNFQIIKNVKNINDIYLTNLWVMLKTKENLFYVFGDIKDYFGNFSNTKIPILLTQLISLNVIDIMCGRSSIILKTSDGKLYGCGRNSWLEQTLDSSLTEINLKEYIEHENLVFSSKYINNLHFCSSLTVQLFYVIQEEKPIEIIFNIVNYKFYDITIQF